jgi:hypothetical protein
VREVRGVVEPHQLGVGDQPMYKLP